MDSDKIRHCSSLAQTSVELQPRQDLERVSSRV